VARIIRQQGEAAMFGVISNSHQISAWPTIKNQADCELPWWLHF
jgi:hypothetical protein